MLYAHLQHHNDTIIKTQWQRQTQEDFFINKFTSHFICKDSKRLCGVLLWEGAVRGSWRSNITEIFWPQSYGRQRCVFLVLQGCSTEGPGPTLLGNGFLYCILSASSLDPNSSGPQASSAWCGFLYHTSSLSVSNCLQLSWPQLPLGLELNRFDFCLDWTI